MTKFKNKTVLITGAANGMGKLMAIDALKRGAGRVVLWDINEEGLNKFTGELEAQGHAAHPYVVDVSSAKDIEWAAKDVIASVGPVDILFNNAGIVVGKPFVEHTDRDMQKTIDINVLGVMRVARAFLPDMLRQGSGHIINIASAAGLMANPNMSVYAASKWAVIGWSESLRLELEAMEGMHLNVLTVTPSYIKTGMFDGVKAPLLTPLIEPDDIVKRIMDGVENNSIMLRAPFIVNALPALKGVLPTRVFDFVAGKLGVYSSMDKFKGRPADEAVPEKKKKAEEVV